MLFCVVSSCLRLRYQIHKLKGNCSCLLSFLKQFYCLIQQHTNNNTFPLSNEHPQQALLYLAHRFFHQSLSTVDHFCKLSATISKVNSQITLLPLSNIKYQSPNLPVTCKGQVSSNLLSTIALTSVWLFSFLPSMILTLAV